MNSNPPHLQQSKADEPRHAAAKIVLVSLAVATAAFSLLQHRRLAHASDLTAASIVSAVNNERSLRGITTLASSDKLGAAAAIKSQDMIARHYFAHVDPDGNYIWPTIVAQGYSPYSQLGENLAIEFYDTDSLMSAWMNSPTHRENILNSGFRDQGAGVSFGNVQSGQYYSAVTNTFGTLVAKKPAAQTAQTASSGQTPVKAPQKAPAKKPVKTPAKKPAAPAASKNVSGANAGPEDETAPSPEPAAPQTAAPQNETQAQQIALRGGELAEPSFTVSQPAAASQTPASAAQPAVVVPQVRSLQKLKVNATLLLGLAFLLLLLFDVKNLKDKNFLHLDKKIGNIILLILALTVCAFLYWM